MQDKAWYKNIIENDYFANVAGEQIDGVMACFHDDARVVIRHGDNPERRFAVKPSGDESDLRDFYLHLCGNYRAGFSEFVHFIDEDAQRAACHFLVKLEAKPEGLYADAGTQRLLNCNFFQFSEGLINHVIIYYANPPSGQVGAEMVSKPTGYPPV